jgi:hypothetical protein
VVEIPPRGTTCMISVAAFRINASTMLAGALRIEREW